MLGFETGQLKAISTDDVLNASFEVEERTFWTGKVVLICNALNLQ